MIGRLVNCRWAPKIANLAPQRAGQLFASENTDVRL
jgi:hypothetical protein